MIPKPHTYWFIMLIQTDMPVSKEEALKFVQSDSQDLRLMGAWYFNDYPDLLRESKIQRALIELLGQADQSAVAKVVVYEVLAQIPSCYDIIAPHLVNLNST